MDKKYLNKSTKEKRPLLLNKTSQIKRAKIKRIALSKAPLVKKAIKNGDYKTINKLITNRYETKVTDKDDNTFLHWQRAGIFYAQKLWGK